MGDRDWTHEARKLGHHEGHAVGYNAGRIAGLKEAAEIVSGYIGMEAGKFQVVGAGAIRRAISARISELEGQSNG